MLLQPLQLTTFGHHLLHHFFPTVDLSKLELLYPALHAACEVILLLLHHLHLLLLLPFLHLPSSSSTSCTSRSTGSPTPSTRC